MARTILEVQTELTAAYAARAALMQGKRVSEASFSSAESSRKYIKSEVTLEDLNAYITALENELAALQASVNSITLTQGFTVPNIYRKGGV